MKRETDLAEKLFGNKRLETGADKLKTTTIVGKAVSDSENGYVAVEYEGNITFGDEQTNLVPTGPYVKAGDTVLLTAVGGTGKSISVTNVQGWGDRVMTEPIDGQRITNASISGASINFSSFSNGVITGSMIQDSTIEGSKIKESTITNSLFADGTIEGSKIKFSTFEEGVISGSVIQDSTLEGSKFIDGTIEGSKIKESTLTNSLFADGTIEGSKIKDSTITGGKVIGSTLTDIPYAGIKDADINVARVANAQIASATIHLAQIDRLNSEYAHITEGVIDNAKIDFADINDVLIGTAQIDDAAITTAKIENAAITNSLIKNGAVTDEKVLNLSANKLTAGTIDAAKINVTNLHARNLIVDKLNGQPVIGGYTYISPGSSGYSSKNPSQEGWYEFTINGFVRSEDTEVDENKAYYMDGESALLYDRAYIDSLEEGLNQRIDGAVETWTGDHVPTLENYPAADWLTDDAKSAHVGDIYFVTISDPTDPDASKDGYNYRFAYDNTQHEYVWVLIKDSDVTKALGEITSLQEFESETTSWIEETDEGITAIRQNHTTLSGIVDKTVKSSTQLWYTKADTTAPAKPTAKVTSTATTGNGWRTVVPEWNASYPNYYYCWQFELADGTYAWSDVVRDIAMGESQGTSRGAQATANANIKSSVQLWFTKANSTAPAKPTAQVTTNNPATGNAWNLAVPTYSATYPHYFYCYQQQKGDGTYQWSDVVYDKGTTEAMQKAQAALPATTYDTFVQNTFKELVDTVDEQSSTITTMGERISTTARNLLNATVSPQAGAVRSVRGTGEEFRAEGKWYVYHTESTLTRTEDGIRVDHAGGANGGIVIPLIADGVLADGEKLTLSFDYRTNYTALGALYVLCDPTPNVSQGTPDTLDASGEWKHYEYTWTYEANANVPWAILISYYNSAGKYLEIRDGSMILERGAMTVTTLSNTVNSVQQKADSNSAHLSNLTQTLGTNADGTTKTNDIVHKYNNLDQTLDGTLSTVGAMIDSSVMGTNILTGNALNPFNWTISAPTGANYTKTAYGTAGAKVEFTGVSGYEWLYSPAITVKNGHKYTLSVEYTVGVDYSVASGKGGFGLSAYSSTPPFSSYDSSNSAFLGRAQFFEAKTSKAMKATITFTATSTTVYLGLNGGQIADSSTRLSFTMDSLKLVENVESRMSSAETQISQNANAISLRATKSETYQSAQPNLAPMFSSHNADGTYPNGGVGGYWQPSNDKAYNRSFFTALADGWMHVEAANNSQKEFVPARVDDLEANDRVTMLVEWRNASWTGNGAAFYSRNYPASVQLPANWTAPVNTASGEARHTYTVSTADGTAAWNGLINWTFTAASGGTWTGDIRISFYKEVHDSNTNTYIQYAGPYKPYSGSQLYASQAELKVANDNISLKVNTNGVIGAINLSSETAKISAGKVEIDGTAVFNSISSKVDGAITAKGYATTSQAQGYANAAETNAKSYADSTVNNMTVGSRNLIVGSMEISTSEGEFGWVTNGGNVAEGPKKVYLPGVGDCIYFKKNTTSDKYIPSITTRHAVPVEWGKEYIYGIDIMLDKAITVTTTTPNHFWAGSNANGSYFNTGVGRAADIASQDNNVAYGTKIPANTWVHYEHKFKWKDAPSDANYPYAMIRPIVYGAVLDTEAGSVQGWMRNPYLVEANSFGKTTWSAAPEELPKPNLTPFFSYEPYNSVAGRGGDYWQAIGESQCTAMGDGWCRYVTTDNTSGTATKYDQHRPKTIAALSPDTTYTLLIEFRNVTKTGNVYLRCPDGGQGLNTSGTIFVDGAAGGIDVSVAAGTCHKVFRTGPSTQTNYNVFFGCCTRVDVGAKATYEMRLSLYEGVYLGPYQPYQGMTVVQEQRIYYRSNSTTAPAAPTAFVTSTADANATWTTRRIKYDSTYKYMYTTMQRKRLDGTVSCDPVLLDDTTTVIDGGNIITGSVTANKLNANNINASGMLTVGAISSDTQDDILNSKIKIGSTNLLTKTQLAAASWTHTIANTTQMTGDGYENTWTMVRTAAWEHCYIAVPVTSGVEYTLSLDHQVLTAFDLYSTARPFVFQVCKAVPTSGDNYANVIASIPIGNAVSSKTRGSCTFTATGSTVWLNIPGGYVKDGSTNVSFRFGNVKLEEGNLATSWEPATEDVMDFQNYVIDLSASTYNVDTWYPVIITPDSDDKTTRLKMSFVGEGGTPSWSSHNTKHWSASIDLVYYPSNWGWAYDTSSYLNSYSFCQIPDGMYPITFSNELSHGRDLVMFARGGAIYPISVNTHIKPVVYTTTYAFDSTQSVSPVTTQPVNTSNFVVSREQTQKNVEAAAKTATTYITHVDNNGITIHPSSTTANRVGIDADGVELFKNNVSVAKYAETARIGRSNKARFEMGSSSLKAYDDNNAQYFEVSASGVKWGASLGSTAATTAALNSEINQRKAIYAKSTTAAGTAAKVTESGTPAGFVLYTGASLSVTFTTANTSTTPTLNVNGTGAKTIKGYSGAALTEAEYKWAAGATIGFTYDGTYWRMQDGGALQAKADAASSASTAGSKATAAANSATAAANSATAASGSATTAGNKATAAADSATAAAGSASAASSSASTASSKATAASNSATAAANSASAAADSASTASDKATAASNSATAAANSATEAANRDSAFFGTCGTAAGTQAKVVVCTNFKSTNLKTGTRIDVRCSTAQTYVAAKITLNVNSTGAKDVYAGGAVTSATNFVFWAANSVVTFVYNGSQWEVMQDNTHWSGSCTTAAGTQAKAGTINGRGMVVFKGTVASLAMSNANTHASPTLNVGSTVARNLYIPGATTFPTISNGYSWFAGATVDFVFDGQFWRLVIPESAKFATAMTSNGLMVHKQADTTTGVQITDQVDIIKSGNSVASFQANKIELGKNSASSVIEMCGAKVSVEAETRTVPVTVNTTANVVVGKFEGQQGALLGTKNSTTDNYAYVDAMYDSTVFNNPRCTMISHSKASSGAYYGEIRVESGVQDNLYGSINMTTYGPGTTTVARGHIYAEALGIAPVSLYENESAAFSGAITLSETAANFTRLELFCKDNDGRYCYTQVWHPNGRTVTVTQTLNYGSSFYVKSRAYAINANKIDTASTSGTYHSGEVDAAYSNAGNPNDVIKIVKVLGYR